MRADKFFAERFSSRTKAAEAVERGLVLVNGKKIKPSDEVSFADTVEYIQPDEYYVSNGGYKLSKAIRAFSFDCKGKIFADIGASTGGFTDCLLQNGAKKVYCVDVGESLLDESLAEREEVVVMQNTNARYLKAEDFADPLDGCVVDVSFISLKHILPAAASILPTGGVVLALIKPQFECERKNIGKSGVVGRATHARIIRSLYDFAAQRRLYALDIVNAPVRERKNVEYVIFLKKDAERYLSVERILQKADELK